MVEKRRCLNGTEWLSIRHRGWAINKGEVRKGWFYQIKPNFSLSYGRKNATKLTP